MNDYDELENIIFEKQKEPKNIDFMNNNNLDSLNVDGNLMMEVEENKGFLPSIGINKTEEDEIHIIPYTSIYQLSVISKAKLICNICNDIIFMPIIFDESVYCTYCFEENQENQSK